MSIVRLRRKVGGAVLLVQTVPVVIGTSLFLLGIEDVGVSIEEPFSILPCEDICSSVQGSCVGVLTSSSGVFATRALKGATTSKKKSVTSKSYIS
eukprot:6515334-Pyramimonas_sp.AAC.2